LGCEVRGLHFAVEGWDWRFGVWGFDFGVWGLRFGVWSLGLLAEDVVEVLLFGLLGRAPRPRLLAKKRQIVAPGNASDPCTGEIVRSLLRGTRQIVAPGRARI
jgi:hypothetical protein